MQSKRYNTATELLDNPSFRLWIRTGQDHDGWEQWLLNNPDQKQLVRQAKNMLLAIGQMPPPDEDQTELALSQTWERIRHLEEPSIRRSMKLWWRAAAAILLTGIGFCVYLLSSQGSISMQTISALFSEQQQEQINQTQKELVVNLEDGSSVILQPGSKLSYPDHFEKAERKVHLSGEAFFEISKDAKRPFLVYTRDVVTRVVGTSFRIKAGDENPDVEVLVKTGKVLVSELTDSGAHSPKNVSLLPNQSVSFVKEKKTFKKIASVTPSEKPIDYLTFEFEDTSVAEIFKAIENSYGLTVEYPKALLDKCYLSTSLSDQPLLEKMKIICESLGADTSFEIRKDKIIINSNGCSQI
ncbi:FecR family protein [Dyadobacter luteus]|uniref:FecR family protein n=1 Tax=Dyadobacter luteus TaxID=2259619 RepID=A0A3D8Y4T3_9BACT|nr:FecR family protein [Dyadobacter luteus]REA57428.1 FecR family protein [Dyadobacter luteus]